MRPIPVLLCALVAAPLAAQSAPPDSTVKIETVKVTATPVEANVLDPMQSLTLPAIATITAAKVQQTVNVIDVEDAAKYLPSVFLRKRNNGDTQATLGTRVWGVSSSARSLIFADGVPLSALIANNNNIGGPRWGLVAPAEISRIDVMYGPYSAAYAGNSMGAVMEITTRLPDRLTGSVEHTRASQRFDLYGTDRSFGTAQTAATVGDRFGKLSFWTSANYQSSHSQPLAYATAGTNPSNTTGGFPAENKLGAPANVLGATGLLDTEMLNAKVKAAYDFTPWLRGAYSFGYWRNDGTSAVESYIQTSGGQPTYGGQSAFANGYSDAQQRHSSHSISLRTNTRRDWDGEIVGALYRFDRDRQRLPASASSSDTVFATNGRIVDLTGTGWSSLDLKGAWHKGGLAATHTVSFGLHGDRYHLENPTYDAADWRTGDPTSVATEGDGNTRTLAAWAQDAWWVTPNLRFTLGARLESWRAYDGYNQNGATTVDQPEVNETRVSPKAIVAWTPNDAWALTLSAARAYRFATASELYQLVSTAATFTAPQPDLKPDDVLAGELRVARRFDRASVQVALFQDDVHDAIISQFLPLAPNSSTLYSYLSNVDHVRARGIELSAGGTDLLVRGLDLSASATYLDARTLALKGAASASGQPGAAEGKFLPNIPQRRATFTTTYRATPRVSLTAAGRYSSKIYTTLDNADVNPNTYQGFSEWFVADVRALVNVDRHWTASVGADNVLDRKYFLFHPFPQRTLVGSVRYAF